MEAQQGSVIKIRPATMELAVPSFQPTVVSSPANMFIQSVRAQSYSENRMVFNFRSPSANLLCSPLLYVVFKIKIQCPYKLNKASQIGPLLGSYDTNTTNGEATAGPGTVYHQGTNNQRKGYGYRPMFAFSGGNAVMNACESKSITINGSTWSELNSNQYLRSLDRCYAPDDVMQRAWSTCGGSGNRADSVPISGHVLGLPDSLAFPGSGHTLAGIGGTSFSIAGLPLAGANDFANIDSHGFRPTEGSTMDSGLKLRMENFYDQIVGVAAGDVLRTYTLEIKAPISGSVFNDLWGESGLSRSDPRMRQALGLCHINSVQVVLQFKSLFKTLIRRLGRPNQSAAANAVLGAVSALNDPDVIITLDQEKPPTLRALYIRLPAFRSYPQSAALSVYRREIRRPNGTRSEGSWGKKVFCSGLWGGAIDGEVKGLRCAGDFDCIPSSLVSRPTRPSDLTGETHGHTQDVSWTGCQFPQVPSYILICYQKDPAYTTYNNPFFHADRIAAPNGVDYRVKWGLVAPRNVFDSSANINLKVCKHVLAVGAAADALITNTQAIVFDQEVAARNIAMAQDSNAAIMQIEIVVQSAIGSFAFRDGTSGGPYLEDRDVLWRRHLRNCHSQYSKAGRAVWQDRECCALLASSDFCLGLSTSPGTQYPITLDVRVRFANRASYRGGGVFLNWRTKGPDAIRRYYHRRADLSGPFPSERALDRSIKCSAFKPVIFAGNHRRCACFFVSIK